jgi:hypothetical protein
MSQSLEVACHRLPNEIGRCVTRLSYVQIDGSKGWVRRDSLEKLFELLEGVGL